LGWTLALVPLLAVGTVAYRNARALTEIRPRIAHVHEVLHTLDAVITTLQDAEIAGRGYLLTRDDELASRRELARPVLLDTLARLRALVADNAVQRPRVESLDVAVRATLAFGDDTVEARGARPFGRTELTARLGEAARRMEEIESLAAQIQFEEQHLLALRQDAAERRTSRLLAALVGETALGTLFLAAVVVALQRETRRRRAIEARLGAGEPAYTAAPEAADLGVLDAICATAPAP